MYATFTYNNIKGVKSNNIWKYEDPLHVGSSVLELNAENSRARALFQMPSSRETKRGASRYYFPNAPVAFFEIKWKTSLSGRVAGEKGREGEKERIDRV